jgi:hypothetical protein
MDFYRASNSPSSERLWKALYVEDEVNHDDRAINKSKIGV